MANMLDYIREYGSLSLNELPFTPVDNLILAQLAYCGWGQNFCEGASETRLLPSKLGLLAQPKQLAKLTLPGGLIKYASVKQQEFGVLADENKELFNLAAASRRFKDATAALNYSVLNPGETLQFSAVTFILDDGSAYVAFRGTDSTLVGWKEDFNLALSKPVPAQLTAVKYIENVAYTVRRPLRVGGHSKGGNLAVYAAAMCQSDTQKRITEVYSNDGPGQYSATLKTPGYKQIKSRIRQFVPSSSIVGMLLESDCHARVVESSAAFLKQHNPYTWLVDGADFVYAQSTSLTSRLASDSLRLWLEDMPQQKKQALIDIVFYILEAGGAQTLKQLKQEPLRLLPVLGSVLLLDRSEKRLLEELAVKLAKAALEGCGDNAQELKSELKERETSIKEKLNAVLGFLK